jgi:hypothetical protein
MVLHRSYVLGSKFGHSIGFDAGKPTWVPPNVVPEAVAVGAAMADGTSADIITDPVVPKAPSDPAVRAADIEKAFVGIAARNERDDFMASGTPTSEAVSKVVGYKVPSKEISQVWSAYKERLADVNPLPAAAMVVPKVEALLVDAEKRRPGRPRKSA